MLRVDHVIYAVQDLDRTATDLAARHGLRSLAGGRHPAWGTENRIVPLGGAYVELVAVCDASVAAGSDFGRAVATAAAEGDQLVGWAVASDDLDAVGKRLGLEVTRGSRVTPDGSTLSWKVAGVERALATGALPFFIQWDGPSTAHPGNADIEHGVEVGGIAWLEVEAPPSALAAWLGEFDLPLRVTEGPPAITAVGISTDASDIVLR